MFITGSYGSRQNQRASETRWVLPAWSQQCAWTTWLQGTGCQGGTIQRKYHWKSLDTIIKHPLYIYIFLISSNDTSLSALSMRTNLTSLYYVDVILTFYIIQLSQSHENRNRLSKIIASRSPFLYEYLYISVLY